MGELKTPKFSSEISWHLSLTNLLFCNYFRGWRSGWGFGSCTNVSKFSPQSWISLLIWRIQLFVWTSNASQSVCFWIPEFEPDDTWKICQKNSSKNLSKKFVKNFVKRVFCLGVIGLKFRNPETNTLRDIRCSDKKLFGGYNCLSEHRMPLKVFVSGFLNLSPMTPEKFVKKIRQKICQKNLSKILSKEFSV